MYLQCRHGWCHMKLLPSQHKFCVHHTTMHHVTSCKATYVRCMHHATSCKATDVKCLAITCHLHFWQSDWDLLHATAVTWGWNGYWSKSQHTKLTLEKKILPPLLQGFNPRRFNHESDALTTELSLPLCCSSVSWYSKSWRHHKDVAGCGGCWGCSSGYVEFKLAKSSPYVKLLITNQSPPNKAASIQSGQPMNRTQISLNVTYDAWMTS